MAPRPRNPFDPEHEPRSAETGGFIVDDGAGIGALPDGSLVVVDPIELALNIPIDEDEGEAA